ncbi:MAG: DUF1592 domain-containing protein, partial [Verrucomicrobiota bacterium]
GGPPDRALYDRLGEDEVLTRDEKRAVVRRLLRDPRARAQSLRFASDWLSLDRLANLRPSEERFPRWTAEVGDDMRAETLAFFDDVVWEQSLPLAELFSAPVTYLTPRLAEHYGLAELASSGSPPDSLQRVSLRDVPMRGGLLTQGSLLTMGGDEASMVTRGLYLLQDVLRGVIKAPPPGLDTTPVPASAGESHRTIAEKRIANRSCGGCHEKFEPLAFGLEKFDGLGAYHDQDEFGNELREDGEILIPGEAEAVSYGSIGELMSFLAKSDRVQKTMTWKVTQFALGRPLTASDVSKVDAIHAESLRHGGTYAATVEAIAASSYISF